MSTSPAPSELHVHEESCWTDDGDDDPRHPDHRGEAPKRVRGEIVPGRYCKVIYAKAFQPGWAWYPLDWRKGG